MEIIATRPTYKPRFATRTRTQASNRPCSYCGKGIPNDHARMIINGNHLHVGCKSYAVATGVGVEPAMGATGNKPATVSPSATNTSAAPVDRNSDGKPIDGWRYARAGGVIVGLPLVLSIFGPVGAGVGLLIAAPVAGILIYQDVVGESKPGYR